MIQYSVGLMPLCVRSTFLLIWKRNCNAVSAVPFAGPLAEGDAAPGFVTSFGSKASQAGLRTWLTSVDARAFLLNTRYVMSVRSQ